MEEVNSLAETSGIEYHQRGISVQIFQESSKKQVDVPIGHLWSAGGCATTVGYNEYATVLL